MSGNLSGFNPDDHQDSGGDFEVIPAGKYKAMMVKSEMRDTKAGTGTYLNTQWQIVEGEFAGRVFFHMLTRTNPNPKAVEIGDAQIANICRATGVTAPSDSSELHDKPLIVKLVIKTDDYGTKNNATSFTSLATPIDAAQPAASGGGGPSWTK